MDTKRFIVPVIAMLFMTEACSIPEPESATISKAQSQKVVAFSAESCEPQTKTAFQEDETSIWWSPGDEIAIFYGASNGSKFTATNDTEKARVEFQGELDTFTGVTESGELNYFWAIYPYTSAVNCDGESVVATLSDKQLAKAGSFAPNTNVTVAKSPGLALSFYNVCSWFRFTVKKEGVKRVILRGNNNEDIAGEFRVVMGTDNRPSISEIINGKKTITLEPPENESFEVGEKYFITLLPQVFKNGFTVTFQTEMTAGARSVNNKAAFLRSKYNTGIEFDKTVDYYGFEYNIGDIVYCDGWGVVSSVSEDTGELLLMSVTQLSGQNWPKSNEWCNAYGQSWKMPTSDELKLIRKNFSTINDGLSYAFYEQLPDDTKRFAWSCSEGDPNTYWVYNFWGLGSGSYVGYNGSAGHPLSKLYTRAVRWASCFDILPDRQLAPIPIHDYEIFTTFKDASWSVKNTWEEGDKIFVFLKKMRSSESNKYLTLIYDGIKFNVLPNDIDSRELSGMSDEDRKLTAIYVPSPDAQVIFDGDEYQIKDKKGDSIVSYYLCSNSDYQWDGTTMTMLLTMGYDRNYIKFYIGGITDRDRYKLSVPPVTAIAFDKISIRDLSKTIENGSFQPQMMSLSEGDGLVFYGSGNINADVQALKRYIFVLYDETESKTYVITRKASLLDVVGDSVILPSNPEINWAELEDQQWIDMGTTHKWSFFDYGFINRVSTTDEYNVTGYLFHRGERYTGDSTMELFNAGLSIASDTDWRELNHNCTVESVNFQLASEECYGFIVLPNNGGESFLFLPDTKYWMVPPDGLSPNHIYYAYATTAGIYFNSGSTSQYLDFKYPLRCVKPDN